MNTVYRCFVLLVSLSCTIAVHAQQRSADDPWWFEIEAIVFERNVKTSELEESFPLIITPVDTVNLPSFISDTLYPDFSLLRMGAKQCLKNQKAIRFPKQTAELPQFKTASFISEITEPAQTDFFENSEFRNNFLDNHNLADAEFIVTHSPSLQWLKEVENVFGDFSQDFAKWREDNPATSGIARFPMTQFQTSNTSPSISLPEALYCNWSEELDMFASDYGNELQTTLFLDSVPRVINGIEYPFSDHAYTLPADKLTMTKLKRDIQRRRGLNVILHTAWRQNVVVGRDKAPWYRFYAGDNYSRQYDYKGLPIAAQEAKQNESAEIEMDIFDQIQAILEQPENTTSEEDIQLPLALQQIEQLELQEGLDEVWTLDGRLKVFIEYIGGTPYLHIDSDLNYRKPVFIDWMAMVSNNNADTESGDTEDVQRQAVTVVPQDNFLQAYHLDQIRRVISNEIHYFDHPLFGMVFQIRRYRRPDPELPPDYYD